MFRELINKGNGKDRDILIYQRDKQMEVEFLILLL